MQHFCHIKTLSKIKRRSRPSGRAGGRAGVMELRVICLFTCWHHTNIQYHVGPIFNIRHDIPGIHQWRGNGKCHSRDCSYTTTAVYRRLLSAFNIRPGRSPRSREAQSINVRTIPDFITAFGCVNASMIPTLDILTLREPTLDIYTPAESLVLLIHHRHVCWALSTLMDHRLVAVQRTLFHGQKYANFHSKAIGCLSAFGLDPAQ